MLLGAEGAAAWVAGHANPISYPTPSPGQDGVLVATMRASLCPCRGGTSWNARATESELAVTDVYAGNARDLAECLRLQSWAAELT